MTLIARIMLGSFVGATVVYRVRGRISILDVQMFWGTEYRLIGTLESHEY